MQSGDVPWRRSRRGARNCKYWRMPRAWSSLTAFAFALATAFAAGAIQTLSTPSTGAIQLRYLSSGLICTLARSGLPNSASRGMGSTSVVGAG